MGTKDEFMKWLDLGTRWQCPGHHLFAQVEKGGGDLPGPSSGISYKWYVARPGLAGTFATGEVHFTGYENRTSDLALAKRLAKAALKTFDERADMEETDNI